MTPKVNSSFMGYGGGPYIPISQSIVYEDKTLVLSKSRIFYYDFAQKRAVAPPADLVDLIHKGTA